MKGYHRVYKAPALLLAAAIVFLAGCAGGKASGPALSEEGPAEPDFAVTVTHNLAETESAPESSREMPYAAFSYDTVALDADSAGRYPALASALEEWRDSMESVSMPILAELVYATAEALEDGRTGISCSENRSVRIGRADRGIFSAMTTLSGYYGGAHPTTGFAATNLDPATGETVGLAEVLADEEQLLRLPLLLFDHLETVVEGGYEFSDEERDSILATLWDEAAGERLSWMLTEEGFECRFDAYELMYYAMGPMSALIPYGEEPGLLAEAYRPENAGKVSLEGRLTETEAAPRVCTYEELEPYYRSEPEPEIDPAAMRLTVSQQEMVTAAGIPVGETGETVPFARVNYPAAILSEDTAARWPKLARALEEANDEAAREALPALASLGRESREAYEAALTDTTFYEDNWLVAARADENAFSVMYSKESNYGGQEVFYEYSGRTWSPETGERLRLADIIAGPGQLEALPRIILDELILLSGERFTEEEKEETAGLVAQMVEADDIAWALGENGLEFGFAPYELTGKMGDMGYASLAYATYPDLVAPEYLLPEGAVAMDYRTDEEWPDTIRVSDEELEKQPAL